MKKFNDYYLYIILFILISIFYLPYFDLNSLHGMAYPSDGITVPDYQALVLPSSFFIKNTILKFHQLPLWNPYKWGGTPDLGIPLRFNFYPFFFIFFLLGKYSYIINLLVLFHVYLAAIGIFLLTKDLFNDEKIAFVSTLVYLFSGPMYSAVFRGFISFLFFFALLPWMLLFLRKSVKEKRWINKYWVFASIVLALLYYTGAVQYFLYSLILVSVFFLVEIIYCLRKPKQICRHAFVMSLLFLIAFGLIAPKLIPDLNFVIISNRSHPFLSETFPGIFSSFDKTANQLFGFDSSYVGRDVLHYLGIIPVILMFLSLKHIRKKEILFCWLLILLSLIFVSASPLYQLLYKLPGIGNARHITRFLLFYFIGGTILAGYGSSFYWNNFKKKKTQHLVFYLIFSLVFLNLFIIRFHDLHEEDIESKLGKNNILNYIGQQPGIFRIHSMQTRGVDNSLQAYTMPLGIETLYGFDGTIWNEQYFRITLPYTYWGPAKAFGILNTKYIISTTPFENESIKLLNKFKVCDECFPERMNGPYLYENELWMPRAYFVDKSILTVGDYATDLMYQVFLEEKFDPTNLVIIKGPASLSDLSWDELKKFDAVVFAEANLNNAEFDFLKQYYRQGGVVIPDVFKLQEQGQLKTNQVVRSLDEGSAFLERYNTNYTGLREVEHLLYTPNKRVLKTSGLNKGFLVLSEKFYMFPDDWHNNLNAGMYLANGGVTALYLEGNEDDLTFAYFPESFKRGLLIFFSTLLLVIFFLLI